MHKGWADHHCRLSVIWEPPGGQGCWEMPAPESTGGRRCGCAVGAANNSRAVQDRENGTSVALRDPVLLVNKS